MNRVEWNTCPIERGEEGSNPKPYSAAAAAASACVTVPGPILRNPTFLNTFNQRIFITDIIFSLEGLRILLRWKEWCWEGILSFFEKILRSSAMPLQSSLWRERIADVYLLCMCSYLNECSCFYYWLHALPILSVEHDPFQEQSVLVSSPSAVRNVLGRLNYRA